MKYENDLPFLDVANPDHFETKLTSEQLQRLKALRERIGLKGADQVFRALLDAQNEITKIQEHSDNRRRSVERSAFPDPSDQKFPPLPRFLVEPPDKRRTGLPVSGAWSFVRLLGWPLVVTFTFLVVLMIPLGPTQ